MTDETPAANTAPNDNVIHVMKAAIAESMTTQIAMHIHDLADTMHSLHMADRGGLFQVDPVGRQWLVKRRDRIIGDVAAHAAQCLMEIAELAELAQAWAKAEATANALIDRAIDLRHQQAAFVERAEPFGPSLAKNEAEKIGKEIDALEIPIAKACAAVETAREALDAAARGIGMAISSLASPSLAPPSESLGADKEATKPA